MENRIQLLNEINAVLNHLLQTAPVSNSGQNDLIDTFIETYTGNTQSCMRLSLPVLSSNSSFTNNSQGNKDCIPTFILRDFLTKGNPFPPQDQHVSIKKVSSNRNDNAENAIITKSTSDTEHENNKEIYTEILFTGEDSNSESCRLHRENVKKKLHEAMDSLREGLTKAVHSHAKSYLKSLLARTVRKSVLSNNGLVSRSAACCMAGNFPKKIHTEESDQEVVEEALKDFQPLASLPLHTPSSSNLELNHVATIEKIVQPITFRRQLCDSIQASQARQLNVNVGTCTASFSVEDNAGSASGNTNRVEKNLLFNAQVEIKLLDKSIPVMFSTRGELHAEFTDASVTYPNCVKIIIDSKKLLENITKNVSKGLKDLLIEENKIRTNYLSKMTKPVAIATNKTNPAQKKKKGIKRKMKSSPDKKNMSFNQGPSNGMPITNGLPIQYAYMNNHIFYHTNQGFDQNGLNSSGNAAEAYWMTEEAKIRRDSFGSRSSFMYRGGLPNFVSNEFDPSRQNFNRFSSSLNDPYSSEHSNFVRHPHVSNDQYDYIDPRRSSKMVRRQSSDSMVAAIEAVCMAEMEAERRQRSSFHEAMSLLDVSGRRPSLTIPMTVAAAEASRYADMDNLRRSSFLSTSSVDNFDPFSRNRMNQYSFDDSLPNLNKRRKSSGPESVLAAAEIVRLAELKQTSCGPNNSKQAAEEMVRTPEQITPNRFFGYPPGRNSFGGMSMNDYVSNQYNTLAGTTTYPSMNDRSFWQYNYPSDTAQDPTSQHDGPRASL